MFKALDPLNVVVESGAARLGSFSSLLLRVARPDHEEVKPLLEVTMQPNF